MFLFEGINEGSLNFAKREMSEILCSQCEKITDDSRVQCKICEKTWCGDECAEKSGASRCGHCPVWLCKDCKENVSCGKCASPACPPEDCAAPAEFCPGKGSPVNLEESTSEKQSEEDKNKAKESETDMGQKSKRDNDAQNLEENEGESKPETCVCDSNEAAMENLPKIQVSGEKRKTENDDDHSNQSKKQRI